MLARISDLIFHKLPGVPASVAAEAVGAAVVMAAVGAAPAGVVAAAAVTAGGA